MFFILLFFKFGKRNFEHEFDMLYGIVMKTLVTTSLTPGHLKQVICRILRTVHQKMTQIRVIHKKGCRMRKGILKMTQKYIDF